MPRLTPEQRDAAVKCVRKGESQAVVAKRFGIKPCSLRGLCKTRGMAPITRTGRPRKVG